MLTCTLGSLSSLSRVRQVGGRAYSTATATSSASDFSFAAVPVHYGEFMRVKRERFGRCLEQFKASYEAPLVKLHAEISEKKHRQLRKLQYRHTSRASRIRRREKRAKKNYVAEIDSPDFKMQDQLREIMDEEDLTLAQFMTSGDPRVEELMNQPSMFENINMRFDAFEMEAVENDTWWSSLETTQAFKPSRLDLAPGQLWHWEKHLDPIEFAKVVTTDILSLGIPIRDDATFVPTGLEHTTNEDFERQSDRISPKSQTHGLAMPLSPEWMPVRVSAPAVLSKDQIPPKRFKKIKRHVKYDHETPFVLETNEWPILKGIIETGNRMVEEAHSMMRKAKLYIRVKRLNLPRPVMRRLLELAASRYDPKLRAIIINEDSMPTQDQNISKVYKVAAALLHEAWKADLNYVPIKDPLPLHQQIQREVDLEAEQKAEQEAMEPANFVKPKQITLFRLGSFPRLDAIEAERQRVQSLVKSIVGAQQ